MYVLYHIRGKKTLGSVLHKAYCAAEKNVSRRSENSLFSTGSIEAQEAMAYKVAFALVGLVMLLGPCQVVAKASCCCWWPKGLPLGTIGQLLETLTDS